MYKRRWYDGLHDIYEGKDEFEIKFGCFGGDGGSKGGPKTDPKPTPTPTPTPTPNDGFRGEQSTAVNAAAQAAKTAAQAEVEANLAGKAQAAQDLQGKVAEAVAASQASPTTSLDTSMQNMTMNEALGLNVPTVAEQLAPTQVGLPGTTVAPAAKSLADMYADAQKAVANQVFSEYQSQPNLATQNYMDYQSGRLAPISDGPKSGFSVSVPSGASFKNPGIQVNYSAPIGPQASVTPDITRSGVMSALGVPGSYQTAAVAPTTVTSPINDPTAQAGIGSFFTETVPGVFGFSPPTKGKSKSSKTKSAADRFKGTRVRTKPVGVGEYFTNLFTG